MNDYCNSPVSLHLALTMENPNTMNDADLEKEKRGCGSLAKKRECG